MGYYYVLKEEYELQSWQNEVFVLFSSKDHNRLFLTKEEYTVINMCDGTVDFSSWILPNRYKEITRLLLEQGILFAAGEKRASRQISSRVYDAPYISQAQWSITGNCNYRCRHCYMSAPEGRYGELSFEECLDIISQLKECGIDKVSLTGGEPLVRKDFLAILDALQRQEIIVSEIYTNGALVNQSLLQELEKRNMTPEFSISFDGKGHHDWMRGIDGAEEKAVRAFELLRSYGFQTTAEMCVHRKNINSIRDTVLLLAGLGVRAIKITPASPSGLWKENGRDEMIPLKDLFDAYLEYIPQYFKDGAPMSIMLGGFFACEKGSKKYKVPSIKFDNTENCKDVPLCMSARENLYIAADAKVLPCISMTGMEVQENFPSLKKTSLRNILKESYYWKMVSSTVGELLKQNEECRSCPYRYQCGGGCRAGALMSDGSYFGKDKTTCFIFQEGYPEKIAHCLE